MIASLIMTSVMQTGIETALELTPVGTGNPWFRSPFLDEVMSLLGTSPECDMVYEVWIPPGGT